MSVIEDELTRRAKILLDVVEDWYKHTSDPHDRVYNLTMDPETLKGESWEDADFDEVLGFIEQCIAELGN